MSTKTKTKKSTRRNSSSSSSSSSRKHTKTHPHASKKYVKHSTVDSKSHTKTKLHTKSNSKLKPRRFSSQKQIKQIKSFKPLKSKTSSQTHIVLDTSIPIDTSHDDIRIIRQSSSTKKNLLPSSTSVSFTKTSREGNNFMEVDNLISNKTSQLMNAVSTFKLNNKLVSNSNSNINRSNFKTSKTQTQNETRRRASQSVDKLNQLNEKIQRFEATQPSVQQIIVKETENKNAIEVDNLIAKEADRLRSLIDTLNKRKDKIYTITNFKSNVNLEFDKVRNVNDTVVTKTTENEQDIAIHDRQKESRDQTIRKSQTKKQSQKEFDKEEFDKEEFRKEEFDKEEIEIDKKEDEIEEIDIKQLQKINSIVKQNKQQFKPELVSEFNVLYDQLVEQTSTVEIEKQDTAFLEKLSQKQFADFQLVLKIAYGAIYKAKAVNQSVEYTLQVSTISISSIQQLVTREQMRFKTIENTQGIKIKELLPSWLEGKELPEHHVIAKQYVDTIDEILMKQSTQYNSHYTILSKLIEATHSIHLPSRVLSTYMKLLTAQELKQLQPPMYRKQYVLITPFIGELTFHDFLISIVKEYKVEDINLILHCLCFQVLFTLYHIQTYYPNFRHNDLILKNIYITGQINLTTKKKVIYKFKEHFYEVPYIGIQAVISNFWLSSLVKELVNPLLNNANIRTPYGIVDCIVPFYDLHTFFVDIYRSLLAIDKTTPFLFYTMFTAMVDEIFYDVETGSKGIEMKISETERDRLQVIYNHRLGEEFQNDYCFQFADINCIAIEMKQFFKESLDLSAQTLIEEYDLFNFKITEISYTEYITVNKETIHRVIEH